MPKISASFYECFVKQKLKISKKVWNNFYSGDKMKADCLQVLL